MRKYSLFTALLLAFALIMTACTQGTDAPDTGAPDTEPSSTPETTPDTVSDPEETAAPPTNGDTDAATRIVSTLRGDVEIPADPQRIADVSGISDMLYIIGRLPVATADSDAYDYTRFPTYLEEELAGVTIVGYPMSDTVDIEAILACEPDLIIINPRQEKAYDQLSQIATTIVIEPSVNDWRGDIRMVGELFDAADTVEAYITEYETKAKTVGDAIKAANGEDATYFSFLTSGTSYYLFTGAAFGDIFYNDMGLSVPENLPEQDSITLPTANLEGLTEIAADYMVVLASEDDRATLEASSVWNSIEAVEKGNVVWLSQSPYFNQAYSVYGKMKLLDELLTLLAE